MVIIIELYKEIAKRIILDFHGRIKTKHKQLSDRFKESILLDIANT